VALHSCCRSTAHRAVARIGSDRIGEDPLGQSRLPSTGDLHGLAKVGSEAQLPGRLFLRDAAGAHTAWSWRSTRTPFSNRAPARTTAAKRAPAIVPAFLGGLDRLDSTTARDEPANRPGWAGESAPAARLGNLRRPSLAARGNNLFVREEPDEAKPPPAYLKSCGTRTEAWTEQLTELNRQKHAPINASHEDSTRLRPVAHWPPPPSGAAQQLGVTMPVGPGEDASDRVPWDEVAVGVRQ